MHAHHYEAIINIHCIPIQITFIIYNLFIIILFRTHPLSSQHHPSTILPLFLLIYDIPLFMLP